jgi:hypothetical protein
MQIANVLAGINWLAVIVATAAAFALGGLWYSKAMFGSAWMEEIGLDEQSLENANMAGTFGGTFCLQFVAATGLAAFLVDQGGWLYGLHTGLMVALLWIATSFGINYLFEQRSLRLYLINVGYNVLSFAVMGTILGIWR